MQLIICTEQMILMEKTETQWIDGIKWAHMWVWNDKFVAPSHWYWWFVDYRTWKELMVIVIVWIVSEKAK